MNPKAFFKMSYGMYVVCSKDGDKVNGQIANTVTQVASEPALIAVAINKKNLTHEYIDKSKVLTVSILAQDTPLSSSSVSFDLPEDSPIAVMKADTGRPDSAVSMALNRKPCKGRQRGSHTTPRTPRKGWLSGLMPLPGRQHWS